MEVRKLIKFGNSSHVISIPNVWLKKNNLNKGDVIYFEENGNNELVLKPQNKEEKKEPKTIVISTKDKSVLQIQREIIKSYINNYDTIKIRGKELEKISDDIRDILNNLVAIEILEQTREEITAKDFLSIEDSSIEKIIRRIDTIIKVMLEDISFSENSDIFLSIKKRDKDVNRLMFLIYRIINNAQQNPKVLNTLKLKEEHLLSYWIMAMSLEKIADNLKRATQFNRVPDINEKARKDLTKIYEKIKLNYNKIMSAYYGNDITHAMVIADERRQDLLVCNRFCEKHSNVHGNMIVDEFKDLITHIGDITRVVYLKG